nr:diguanylate cyclase [uncultured Pseudoxanthomonas sp.]
MKRGRLQGVAARVGQFASSSSAAGQLVGTYYFHDEVWYEVESASAVDAPILKELQQAQQSKSGYFRRPASADVYFRHDEFNAVTKIRFASRPAAKTIGRFQSGLNGEILNAKNEFLAKHDSLTECFNKAALDEKLLELFEAGSIGRHATSGATGTISQLKSIYLISMDLDHFKSINDNHGHLYGDLVLRAFSWRVDASVERWLSALEVGGTEVIFARPGGEEFQVVVSGSVTIDQVFELANSIRADVSAEALPSRDEHKVLKKDGKVETDVFPPESERGVTVSIGVSVMEHRAGERRKQAISRMLREADLALYSAKGGGRNVVRLFSEILKNHVRTIEHIPETKLVAIDAGGEIGVRLGQEFLVYPPRFDGVTAYFAGEGRSRRRLGVYPRYPIARMSVVSVQTDVAFCKIDEWIVEIGGQIPDSSTLQAVPLGSISHLVSTPGSVQSKLATSVDALRAQLKTEREERRSVATFLLQGIHEFASAKGLRAANAVLASAFEAIVESVPGRGHVAMVADDAFVVVARSDDEESFVDEVKVAITRISRAVSGQVDVRAGMFDAVAGLDLANEGGIELSMLAAVSAKTEDLVVFDEWVAVSVVSDAIGDQKYDQARADLDKLFELGYRRSPVVNQAGLLEFYSGKYELAYSLFNEARLTNQEDPTLALNEATALVELGRWEEAYDLYQANFDSSDDAEGYLGAYAVTALTLLEQGNGKVAFEVAERIVGHALEVPVSKLVTIEKAAYDGLRARLDACRPN